MNSDNINYALSVLPFLPYSKTVVKSVLSHTASLSIGLVAFITTKTIQGGAPMKSDKTRTPDINDYLLAHPLALPFWVCGFVYLFFNIEGMFNPVLVMMLVAFWLHIVQHSLTTLLEYQAADEGKEAFPCTELAKT
mgnify:FL=1